MVGMSTQYWFTYLFYGVRGFCKYLASSSFSVTPAVGSPCLRNTCKRIFALVVLIREDKTQFPEFDDEFGKDDGCWTQCCSQWTTHRHTYSCCPSDPAQNREQHHIHYQSVLAVGNLKLVQVIVEARVDLHHNQPLESLLHMEESAHWPVIIEITCSSRGSRITKVQK